LSTASGFRWAVSWGWTVGDDTDVGADLVVVGPVAGEVMRHHVVRGPGEGEAAGGVHGQGLEREGVTGLSQDPSPGWHYLFATICLRFA
jgi:hypothetical protein